MEDCDNCGEKGGAEYVLDNRRLCFDCYLLEKQLACAEYTQKAQKKEIEER